MSTPADAKALLRSQNIFERLLVAYPKAHRVEYGAAMSQLFRDQCRDAWDSVHDCRERLHAMRRIPFEFRVPEGKVALQRHIARFPYVPSDPRVRDQRCFEAYNIQVHGLLK